MVRPKQYQFPENMTYDVSCERYIVRNPRTGKKKKFLTESDARTAADLLNEWLKYERQREMLDAGLPTISSLVTLWKQDRMPFLPWDKGTRENVLYKVERISREIGTRFVKRTDCVFIADWMDQFCKTADQWNKWRYAFWLLWDYAVSRKLVAVNEPANILERSTSKKLECNRKVRQPLSLEGFQAIHKAAPHFLQIAMEQSLVTLQARTEICNMRQADYRDGFLYVIRDKTSAETEMAFIRIRITPQLEEIRRRSLEADGVTYLPATRPFLVHRAPDRRRRQWTEGKRHWTYVNPGYLSKAFADAREASKRYIDLEPRQRPSFHEIRGLGARLYQDQGIPETDIQALMTHTDRKTTQIYLDRGAAALADDDFRVVAAPMVLRDFFT